MTMNPDRFGMWTFALAATLSSASSMMPPAPTPPTPPPAGISFNFTFGSGMVLQRAPAKACVYGVLGDGGASARIQITSEDDAAFAAYAVAAETSAGGGWKACLAPHAAGGSFTIAASCTGCANTTAAVLEHVTFGDVWYCAGESDPDQSQRVR